MRPLSSLALLGAALLGCRPPTPAPPPDTSAAARQAIDAANASWARLTAAGHADSLADLYDSNAMILPPNMPPTRGREAIRTFFQGMNAGPHATLTLRSDSVWGSGASAVELGRWNWNWPAGAKLPPGIPAADSGKYMVRWVDDNGHWRMAQDIWNSDTRMPMAAK